MWPPCTQGFPENVLAGLDVPGERQLLFFGITEAGRPAPAGPVFRPGRQGKQAQSRKRDRPFAHFHGIPLKIVSCLPMSAYFYICVCLPLDCAAFPPLFSLVFDQKRAKDKTKRRKSAAVQNGQAPTLAILFSCRTALPQPFGRRHGSGRRRRGSRHAGQGTR
jgi:hypothetical protein